MRHLVCGVAAFILCSGCAAVRSTGVSARPEGVGDGTGGAGAFVPRPDSTTASATPASSPGAPRVPGDSPDLGSMPAPPASPAAPGTMWESGTGKSYVIPAADIVGLDLLLNQFNRHFNPEDVYRTDLSTIQRNTHRGWIIDDDPFAMNQFLHPYQGSVYHGFARSAGLSYWESLGYDFGGSALWEIAGETVPPSLNDQITTSFGGSFLGEALFRMSNILLENDGGRPGFSRELGAGLISPAAGFNRLAFADRFDEVFPSRAPPVFWRTGLGARRNAKMTDLSAGSAIGDEAVADVAMDYGLPGKPGYEYLRPFDYFAFESAATSSSHALPESVMVRGLLYGSSCDAGDRYRGVWGLYGSYDYMSPEIFSVSSTALSLGTTGQYRLMNALALQGTCLGGFGWTAVGTIADAQTDRDYHYGVSPQALVALRLILGDVGMLDMTGRHYYVSGAGSDDRPGSENIIRGQMSLTVRVYGHHALGLQGVATSRSANFGDFPDMVRSVGAVSFLYTYISDTKFGAVEWP